MPTKAKSKQESALGNYLKRAREEQEYTIAQVSKHTRIRPEIVQQLESGDLDSLGSAVYSKGLINLYARFLKLDPEKIAAFYRREFQVEKPAKQTKFLTRPQKLPDYSILYSKKALVAFVVISILILLGFYIASQLTGAFTPPFLKLTAPTELESGFDGEIFVAGNSFQLQGETCDKCILRFNSEILPLEPDNTFITKEIPLRDSQFKAILTTTNQFGRISQISLLIKKGNPGVAKLDKMSIIIEIAGDVTPLLVRADGKIEFDDRAFPGDVITLEASTTLQIESSSPTNVKLKINGDDFKVSGVNTTWALIDGKVSKQ